MHLELVIKKQHCVIDAVARAQNLEACAIARAQKRVDQVPFFGTRIRCTIFPYQVLSVHCAARKRYHIRKVL